MARYWYHDCGGTILTGYEEGRQYYYCDTCGAYTDPFHPDDWPDPDELVWHDSEEWDDPEPVEMAKENVGETELLVSGYPTKCNHCGCPELWAYEVVFTKLVNGELENQISGSNGIHKIKCSRCEGGWK